MNEMSSLFFFGFIFSIIVTGMAHVPRTWRHPVLTGFVFFLFSCIIDIYCLMEYDFPWISSTRVIPLLAAGFFYGPLTALTAGTLSAVEVAVSYWLLLSPSPELARWSAVIGGVEIFSTLLVTGYAILVRRFMLDCRNPNFILSGVLGFFGEIVHIGTSFLIIGLLTRMAGAPDAENAMTIASLSLEFFYSFYPDTPLAAGGTLLAIALLRQDWKNWRTNLLTAFTLEALLFGAVAFFILRYSEFLSRTETAKALAAAHRELLVQIEDQIGYMLHRNAVSIRDTIGKPQKYTIPEMQLYASMFDIDEINIFSGDRRILASNQEAVLKYNRNGVSPDGLNDFFELCSGTREFVKNPFRTSRSDATVVAKYIGVPFSGRSAFLQLGYTRQHLLEEFSTYFFPMFDTARIGSGGFFVVTDLNGKIVAPVAGHKNQVGTSIFDAGMTEKQWQLEKDTPFILQLFGLWSVCTRSDILDNHRIYAVLPDTEYVTPYVRLATLIVFLLFVIAFSFRILILRNNHTQMKLDTVRRRDMELAASIQDSELQKKALDSAVYHVAATMTPAREVGGDFFDYYPLKDGRVVLTIADVSGKGIPAAFVMMKARSVLKSCMFSCATLQDAVKQANERLNHGNQACMFITAWVGIFTPETGTLEYISAGHNPPLLKRAGGAVEWLKNESRHKPLAIFPDSQYEVRSVHTAPGDTLYLYTDGVTEAMSRTKELFGEKRLEKVIRESSGNLIAAVTGALDIFTAKAPQADDITMLTLEIKTNEPDCRNS